MYIELKLGKTHVTPFVTSTSELSMTKQYVVSIIIILLKSLNLYIMNPSTYNFFYQKSVILVVKSETA